MQAALRKNDYQREWLASFDKCIEQDSVYDADELMLRSGAEYDTRILHLPLLWKKYHTQLTKGQFGFGGGFWIAMIREATHERLRGGKDNRYVLDGARSGWDGEYIEERSEGWNEDVVMDADSGGNFLGGEEHWRQFAVL